MSIGPRPSVVETLLAFVNDEVLLGDPTPVAADDDIVLDGTVDSLGVVRIVGFVEEQFGIVVPAEEVVLENFRSIDALADYLTRKSAD